DAAAREGSVHVLVQRRAARTAQSRQHEVLDGPHGRVLRLLPARQAAAVMDGHRRAVPAEGHARREPAGQEAGGGAGAERQGRGRVDARVRVAIHRLTESAVLPSYQTAGAAGFDLAASADVTIDPGAIALVPTGLVISVPAGHFLGIFARSST